MGSSSLVLTIASVMVAAAMLVHSKTLHTPTSLLEHTNIDVDTAISARATEQGMFASVQGTNTAIVMGVGYAIFLALTYGFPAEGLGRSFQSRNSSEALPDDDVPSLLTTLLNIIDPVEISFRYMEIEDSACRKRTLCQMSATPFVGQFLRYMRPSISSLENYQDAMSAGEAKLDCDLVYATCPPEQSTNYLTTKQK